MDARYGCTDKVLLVAASVDSMTIMKTHQKMSMTPIRPVVSYRIRSLFIPGATCLLYYRILQAAMTIRVKLHVTSLFL